jgi:hypothetical protein
MAAAVGSNAMGLDSNIFTGKEVKERGDTLVNRHLEKMQAEKENIAMEKLSALMPQMGAQVRVLALQEAQFDVEHAVQTLRKFATEHEDQLKGLQKVRHRALESMRGSW